jgi:hypothetical protein
MHTEYYPATKYRPNWRKTYQDLRSKGWKAADAKRHAKVYALVNNELDSLVRLVAVADDYFDIGNVAPMADDAEKEATYSRVNSEGFWGCIAQFRLDTESEWIDSDSVYGFVGDDFIDSGYDTDLLESAIREREEYINACH